MTNKFFFESNGVTQITPKKMFTLDDSFQGAARGYRDGNSQFVHIDDELDFINFSSLYLTDEQRIIQEFRAIKLIMLKIKKKHCSI